METKAKLLINKEETACSCSSCGLIFEIYEGKLFKDSPNHFSFACDSCLKKKKYKIEITFSTDQELTNGELADLESAITLQIEEPTDYDQNDVSYKTSQINYKLEEVK